MLTALEENRNKKKEIPICLVDFIYFLEFSDNLKSLRSASSELNNLSNTELSQFNSKTGWHMSAILFFMKKSLFR